MLARVTAVKVVNLDRARMEGIPQHLGQVPPITMPTLDPSESSVMLAFQQCMLDYCPMDGWSFWTRLKTTRN